jgi:hypothetical protein
MGFSAGDRGTTSPTLGCRSDRVAIGGTYPSAAMGSRSGILMARLSI